MRILMLAPHPFYQERGTPIAVDLLLKALAERGDTVDVLTYSEGEDRDYGRTIRLHRIKHRKLLTDIRPGFSLKKLLADVYLYRLARAAMKDNTYDALHAIEESVFMAFLLGRRYHVPYVFDMDSSMPDQIVNKLRFTRPFLPLMKFFERAVVRKAAVVVPMCDALAEAADKVGAARVEVLRDISLIPEHFTYDPQKGFRAALGITGPVVLYIGNLEPYQGIDLLLDGFACLADQHPTVKLVIVGGHDHHIENYRKRCDGLKLHERVYFTGHRAVTDMPHLFYDADIVVSPRIQGTNTPMKVYSYLDAGKPLVATRLPTHTQVMDDEVAMLVEPDAKALARGMRQLLDDPERAHALAIRARQLVQEHYSAAVFRSGVDRIYQAIDTGTEV